MFVETWLNEAFNDAELYLQDYRIYRRDRSLQTSVYSRGGGVLIAVHRAIKSKQLCVKDTIEDVFVHIEVEKKSLILACVYFPPRSPSAAYVSFSENIDKFSDEYPQATVGILGDFNLPHAVWENSNLSSAVRSVPPAVPAEVDSLEILSNLCAFHNLFQLNTITNISNSILDLMLFQDDSCVVCKADDCIVPQDDYHPPLDIIVPFNFNNKNSSHLCDGYYRDFKSANFNLLNDYLGSIAWDSLLAHGSLDDMVNIFYNTIYSAIEIYVPLKRISSGKFPRWFSPELKHCIIEKKKAHKRYKISGLQRDYREFSEMRLICKRLLVESNKNFITSIENSLTTNPKQFWNYVNSKRKSGDAPSEFHWNENSSDSGSEIANMFANYFSQVYSGKYCPDRQRPPFEYNNTSATEYHFLISDIYLHLNSLDINKGPGPDGLPPLLLKHCSFVLARPLHIIFNLSISKGIFPEFWKLSYITPIYKSGKKDLITNYRPISILSTIPKVFEHILTKYLTSILSPMIISSQFGFQAGKNTELNLLTYVDFITEALERGSQVHSIYTDFAKAFDRVNHTVLLSKLESAGVGGSLFSWIESWLTGRSQMVRFNNFLSKDIPVPSGVPQGSHLGPLLFNIFINDLGLRFEHSHFLLFADDLKLYMEISSSDDCLKLQSDLDHLVTWCNNNGMELNTSKCYSIIFHKSRTAFEQPYLIGNTVLSNVSEIKDLGLVLDSKLTFIPHIQSASSKSLQLLGFVRRVTSEFTNVSAIKQLYCSLVRTHLEYSSCVWNPCYNIHIENIERVQHKFLKFIAFKLNTPQLTYQQLETNTHIKSLKQRRDLRDLKMLYSILHSEYSCPSLLYKIGLHVPSRETRQRNTFSIPAHRTNYGLNNFISRSSRLANENPALDFFLSNSVFMKQLGALI